MASKSAKGADLASIFQNGGDAAKAASAEPEPAAPVGSTSSKGQGSAPSPASRRAPKSTGRKTRFTLDLQQSQRRSLETFVWDARERIGRNVDASEVVRSVLEILDEDKTVQARVIERLSQ